MCIERATTCVLALVVAVSGCKRWEVEPVAPAQVVATQPAVVRVIDTSGAMRRLGRPWIRNDSLLGLIPGSSRAGTPLTVATIPLARVDALATQRTDYRRTLGLAVGIPLIGILSALLMGY